MGDVFAGFATAATRQESLIYLMAIRARREIIRDAGPQTFPGLINRGRDKDLQAKPQAMYPASGR